MKKRAYTRLRAMYKEKKREQTPSTTKEEEEKKERKNRFLFLPLTNKYLH